MGELIQGHDPRLNRVLAIEVLPEAAADNTERQEFERKRGRSPRSTIRISSRFSVDTTRCRS
jgi:hypothetical protein